MHRREIKNGIEAICCVHWERRLFDALIPLPDGTSYNAYLEPVRKGLFGQACSVFGVQSSVFMRDVPLDI